MNFTALMDAAVAKQKAKDKIKINRYSLDLPAPKKETKDAARSDVVKKLIQEKENEKKMKDKLQREKERDKELAEKKKAQFKIPKKKPVEDQIPADKEKLINSLFEDEEDDDNNSVPVSNGLDTSSRLSPSDDHSPSSSSHSKTDNHKHSSSHKSSSSSSKDREKSSHSSRESSKSSSGSGDKKPHSSSSSSSRSKSSSSHSKSSSSSSRSKSASSSSSHSKSSSSSSHPKSSSSSSHPKSSSSSKHGTKSSSSSSNSESHNSSSSSSSSSKHNSSSSSSKSTSSPSSNSKPPSSTSPSSAEQPVTLSKHHLKPVAERHAIPAAELSEKEKILAKLAAIKQRTLDAIHKEQQGKGRRSRGTGSQSSSRTTKAEKEDDRVKSKEIVRDIVSSDEETEADKDAPSMIDIMLNEHQSKTERDKIARMAKQAWERATKKDGDADHVSERKQKKRLKKSSSSSLKYSSENRKRREHSLSPEPELKKKSRLSDIEQRKKPKIVRHAGNAAPPPDFQAILAMAAQKVKAPPKPTGLTAIPKKKKEEEVRPMTQEEKERKERVKSKEYQNWLKYGGKYPNNGKENSNSSAEEEEKCKDKNISKQGREKSNSDTHLKNKDRFSAMKRSGQVGSTARSNKEITVNENVLVCGPAEDDDDSGEEIRRGGQGHQKQQQQQSLNPFDRIYSSVHKKKPADQIASKKRRLPDQFDEEEEESDLEGFIDDGEDESGDYSKHIAKIFGYNKNRYVDEDDDVSDMEANFATVMAEEKRSAKIGLMEDLEDMKREEEELRMKAMLKKKMKR